MEEKINSQYNVLFWLNPYMSIIEFEQNYRFGTTANLNMELNKAKYSAIVERLIQGDKIGFDSLKSYFDEMQLETLIAQRIIISDNIEANRYERQTGYLSFILSNYMNVQENLTQKKVIVFGLGGIGSHVVWQLAAMGVGSLTLIDYDEVELNNLNRQLLYTEDKVGKLKTEVAMEALKAFNSNINVNIINQKITSLQDVDNCIQDHDLVIKAIDSPEESLSWINQVCVTRRIPYLSGGFIDYIGTYGPAYIPGKTACFACHNSQHNFKKRDSKGGSFAPITGIVASAICLDAFKILARWEPVVSSGAIIIYDPELSRWQTQPVLKNDACSICSHVNVEVVNDNVTNLGTTNFNAHSTTHAVRSTVHQVSEQEKEGSSSMGNKSESNTNTTVVHSTIIVQKNRDLKWYILLSVVLSSFVVFMNWNVVKTQWQSLIIIAVGILINLTIPCLSSLKRDRAMAYCMITNFTFILILFSLNIGSLIWMPTEEQKMLFEQSPLLQITDFLGFFQISSMFIVVFCMLISLCLLVSGAYILIIYKCKQVLKYSLLKKKIYESV